MPKLVSEVTDNNQFARNVGQGRVADSAIRTFRILLNSPDEPVDIQAYCNVFIGSPHPANPNIPCIGFDSKYENDSRMVLLATFQYGSTPSAATAGGGGSGLPDPVLIPIEIRPANWSISTELTEEPLREWRRRTGPKSWQGDGKGETAQNAWTKPTNPAGDMYEGLSTLRPVTTLQISQFALGGGIDDPTAHCQYVGMVNSDEIILGSLKILPHELMLRGVSATPAVDSWGALVRRGWQVDYNFLYKKQTVIVNFDQDGGEWNIEEAVDIGWDVAVVVEGRNVVCYTPSSGSAWEDPFGQPLKKGKDDVILDLNNLELAEGVSDGDRARAHLKIAGFSERGVTQTPASEPIALNADGTPRLLSGTRKPIIWAYQVYRDIPMVSKLGLRLTL